MNVEIDLPTLQFQVHYWLQGNHTDLVSELNIELLVKFRWLPGEQRIIIALPDEYLSLNINYIEGTRALYDAEKYLLDFISEKLYTGNNFSWFIHFKQIFEDLWIFSRSWIKGRLLGLIIHYIYIEYIDLFMYLFSFEGYFKLSTYLYSRKQIKELYFWNIKQILSLQIKILTLESI